MTHTLAPAALAAALFLAAAAAPAAAQDGDAAARIDALRQAQQVENVYKAYFPDLATARRAAISLHGQLLESNYRDGYLVFELDEAEQALLRRFGFTLERADDFIRQRNELLERLKAAGGASLLGRGAGPQSIPSFACYETVEETFAAAEAFVAGHPTLASFFDIGNSWEKTAGIGGWDLKVLKLTNSAVPGPKPKLFVQAAIHAREYATAPLVLAFARELLDGWGSDADATWILDHHEVHILLQANPDGRKKAETGLSWRKNTDQAYCGATSNSRGADLNRNFTFAWNSTGGAGSSGNPCNDTYRGPSAGSEPEVQAIEAYIHGLWPDRRGPNPGDAAPSDTSGLHLDVHSYSELVLWPWGTTETPAPNGVALQTLGRKFAYFNHYTPMQSIGLYPTDGTSEGPSYGELGVPAYTFEIGTSFFQSCRSYAATVKPDNLPALRYAAKVVRTPYVTPGGPDITALSLAGTASTTGVPAGTPVALAASATDTRFDTSNGAEPTQNIAAAEAYVDTPPWLAGAVARPLQASDGAFNAPTEALSATLSTTGLPPGKHLVYTRAKDAGGTWGAFSAAFLVIGNAPPVLDARFSVACSGLTCRFDASASTGAIQSYRWAFGNRRVGAGVKPTQTYASPGSYSVKLTVSDGSTTDSATQTVVVGP